MRQWAIILDIWKDEPVFHSESTERRGETVCGRKIADGKPFLPRKHVQKFARECRGCSGARPRSQAGSSLSRTGN